MIDHSTWPTNIKITICRDFPPSLPIFQLSQIDSYISEMLLGSLETPYFCKQMSHNACIKEVKSEFPTVCPFSKTFPKDCSFSFYLLVRIIKNVSGYIPS